MARVHRQAGWFFPTFSRILQSRRWATCQNWDPSRESCSMNFRDRQVADPVDLRAVKRRWRKYMSRFSDYEYRKQPGFDMNAFDGASQAIPMKTLVIYCFDPRAAEIPQAVARYFGD